MISESVGVGPCMPRARGRVSRSSEPLGDGVGRMVKIEDRDEGEGDGACERITVVL